MQFLVYAGLRIPKRLTAGFAKVRGAIERDDFASPDVKKLTGHPFFRAKLDYDTRLLLEFVQFSGKKACLALEIIEHHAYDRSRFLRGARVDESAGLAAATTNEAEVDQALVPVRYLHEGRTEFHLLDKPLSFDDRQAELHALPLPMILVGCAGSGKTALTLTKLRELTGDVLYVTHSAYLAESAASLYFAHGYENPAQNVDFSSYAALLASIDVPAGRAVTLADFKAFFQRHAAALRFTTPHQLFEEFRGVLGASARGVLSLEEYLALGVRQSIYRVDQRASVHGFFTKYTAWLKESQLYDTNLVAHTHRARAEPTYDAVVVDEVQDLTQAELALVLALLKEPKGFLLCGDANQIVHPNFFSWARVKSLFYSDEAAALVAPIHVLEVNYRSSLAVTELANTLLQIKNLRFGSIDRESTALVRPASPSAGRRIGLVKKDAVLRELNQRTRGSARVAVIVLGDEQKAEARRLLSTPLVFSVHEAKGLEYDAVILYDVVSSERARFREIAEDIAPDDLKATELTYARARDKNDKSLEAYKFFINALYVAITRAVETVYVVESDTEHPLLRLLGIVCREDVSEVKANASSIEEWQKEARRLELQGKREQAEAIHARILRLTPVPWPVLDRAGFQQAHERAFMPKSVYGKAKQYLFEFAAFHGLGSLRFDLQRHTAFVPAKPFEATAHTARERALGPYLVGDVNKALADVDKYGVEHRNMMGMTPLMMAADTGCLELVEKLIERGARRDAVDTLGRMPVHFALRRAFADSRFAETVLGPLYELTCPTSLELELDGRRYRLTRNQGEFFALACFIARFHELYGSLIRSNGFTTKLVSEDALARFPRNIVPEERRKRTYWNGVLARAEVDASYRPARKLWRRQKPGHYVPSSVRLRVAGPPGQDDLHVPLDELLALPWLEPDGSAFRRTMEDGTRKTG